MSYVSTVSTSVSPSFTWLSSKISSENEIMQQLPSFLFFRGELFLEVLANVKPISSLPVLRDSGYAVLGSTPSLTISKSAFVCLYHIIFNVIMMTRNRCIIYFLQFMILRPLRILTLICRNMMI